MKCMEILIIFIAQTIDILACRCNLGVCKPQSVGGGELSKVHVNEVN